MVEETLKSKKFKLKLKNKVQDTIWGMTSEDSDVFDHLYINKELRRRIVKAVCKEFGVKP